MTIKQRIAEEPVITGGITGGVLAALVGLVFEALASYGVTITPEMQRLIVAVITAVFPIIAAWVARRYATPLANPKDNDGNALNAAEVHVP